MNKSRMFSEVGQIADSVRSVIAFSFPDVPDRPEHLYTLGRGSSLHATTVVNCLMGNIGIPATNLPLNQACAPLQLGQCVLLAVSQSGASPDLCAAVKAAVDQGCPVIGLVNMANSAVSRLATTTLSQCAGNELAVAATKSVVCSIVMGARLAEKWGNTDHELEQLPAQIEAVQQRSVDALCRFLATDEPLLVIGSGGGLGVAGEICLKAQELLGRAAMAYSAAEVLHGPAGMIRQGYPVLALAVGPDAESVGDCATRLSAMGASVYTLDDAPRDDALAATTLLVHCYLAMELACQRLGRSADEPANLKKVTLTEN